MGGMPLSEAVLRLGPRPCPLPTFLERPRAGELQLLEAGGEA